MNRNIISIFLLAAMAVLAVGCTRENVAPEPQPSPTVRNVSYVKCGEPGHATVTGDDAWHALLDTLFDAVDDGCEVSFFDATRGEQMTKETVSYRTASRDSAYAWGERMYDSGYVVSVIFDSENHIYVCSAVKLLPGREVCRNVGISLCGGVKIDGYRVGSEMEWVAMLDSLFDSVDGGCLLAVWNHDYIPDTSQNKSSLTYSTPLRDSAYVWIDMMFVRNYCTTVSFDPFDRVYILSAKPLTTGPQWSNPEIHSLYYDFFTGLTLAVEAEEPLVINSQAQFDSLMPYCFMPYYVDFNTQSLLCVWGRAPEAIAWMEKSIEYRGNDIIVTVNIQKSGYMYPQTWYFALPCDKIYDDQNVSLVVNYYDVQWE